MAERMADLRRRDVRRGLAAKLLTGLAQGIKWLAISLAFSVVVEWIGMSWWWAEEGLDHSRRMLEAEIRYLNVDFDRSLVTSDPLAFAHGMASSVHEITFEATGVTRLLDWASEPRTPGQGRVFGWMHSVLHPIAIYGQAAVQISQVFLYRLAILVLATPVFVLFGLVALVDGLVRRDLRRWGGGRESSFVYHWGKRMALPMLMVAWVLYLALPVSVHPSLVIMPFAALFAVSLSITAGTFKKYL